MKKLYVFALLAVMACAAHAQRFEWAKGYDVGIDNHVIQGAISDSIGNIYILGIVDDFSEWDGVDLTPIIPQGKDVSSNVVIAKISPEGDMLWKKIIASNNHLNAIPYDIRKNGDTAFSCMVTFSLPTNINYTYYLDTFLYGYSDYPLPITVENISNTRVTALITFDFRGNVKEQHFLEVSYIDTAGNDIMVSGGIYPDMVRRFNFELASFDIDTEGNIFISRKAQDNWPGMSTMDGTAIGMKFWVDRELAGTVYVNDRLHGPNETQIMKFSPHLDTLIASRYIMQKCMLPASYQIYKTYTRVDSLGSVYSLSTLSASSNDTCGTIIIDSVQNIGFTYIEGAKKVSFLVKYDSALNANWIIAFDDSVRNDPYCYAAQSQKDFHEIAFDYDSNLLFLLGSTGLRGFLDTVHYYSIMTYNGIPLPMKDGTFIASFYNGNKPTPELHSYNVVPAINISDAQSYSNGNLLCKNNRIFFQCNYFGGIKSPSQTIRYSSLSKTGFGLVTYDYSGKLIGVFDYGIEVNNATQNPGPLVLNDSILYMCSGLGASASFGDIYFPVHDFTNVIAKYVDTSFMHPYVRPAHGIETVAAVAPRVYPVPASERLYFDSPDGGVPTAVTAISLSGWRMPLPATATSADISCLAPGVYILELTTPKGVYYTKFMKMEN